MNQRREWSAVAAVLAATAGAGFSSGRQVVLFFTQMGWSSWIGIVFASSAFGLLCGIICRFAQKTDAKRFSGILAQVLDAPQASAASALHGLLTACVAGMMIASCGALAALSLPIRNAFWIGVLFSTGLALLLGVQRMKRLPAAGSLTLLLCAVFYISLALDPRPVRFHQNYETVPELAGNISAALMLSVLHSALNASVAAEAVVCFSARVRDPLRFSLRCGATMFLLLSAANTAILRGGDRLLPQELPTVLLAARWGVFGYYASILVMWLSSVATLTAALNSLAGRMNDSPSSKALLLLISLAGAVFAAANGLENFIGSIAPMLGCAAVFTFSGLACYSDLFRLRRRFRTMKNMTKYRVKLYELP